MPELSFLPSSRRLLRVVKAVSAHIFERSVQNFPFLGLVLRLAVTTSGNAKIDTVCYQVFGQYFKMLK